MSQIERDRIALIKRIHLGLEKKPVEKAIPERAKVYKPRTPRPKDSEEVKAYRRKYEKEYRQRVHSQGQCRSCVRPAVSVFYVHEENVVMEKVSKYCPHHWEDIKKREAMVKAIEVGDLNGRA